MNDLASMLLKSPGSDQEPVPSIRQLAGHFKVSTTTVHKALRKMQQQGMIFCIPSKGYFWGTKREKPSIPRVVTKTKFEQAKANLLSDFQCGVYHPSNPLPTQQALSQLYQVAPTRIGFLLQHFVQIGVLVRKGRSFYLATRNSDHSHATVLVVSRCNADGQLLFNSERETDFMKAFQRERMRLNLRLEVAGWFENQHGDGKFLDQNGKDFQFKSISGILFGAIVSTWLMRSPILALKNLWKLNIPVSIWWEHPITNFPQPDRKRPSTVGFNISFGQSAGIVVGKYLNRQGYKSIGFISPFHASEWSQNRLIGLQNGFCLQSNSLNIYTNTMFESAEGFHKAAGVNEGERMIRQILSEFIDTTSLMKEKVWVTINDHTALVLIEILKVRGIPRPYIISFDNSTIAESNRIDSFEFHTEGMVRQMFYHLQHPQAILYKDQGLHEMVGQLVIRR